jgi:hypothetical protein
MKQPRMELIPLRPAVRSDAPTTLDVLVGSFSPFSPAVRCVGRCPNYSRCARTPSATNQVFLCPDNPR